MPANDGGLADGLAPREQLKLDALYESLRACRASSDPPPNPRLEAAVLELSRATPAMAAALAARPLVVVRWAPTPNRELLRFLRLARMLGRPPVVFLAAQDKFTPTCNPSKRSIAKMPIERSERTIRYVRVVDFDAETGRSFDEMRCLDGTPFVHFHRELLDIAVPADHRPQVVDLDGFWRGISSRERYVRLFALFTCFGVLAESFTTCEQERAFTNNVVLPAAEQTISRFGVRPRIIRLVPPGQELDPSWDYYPRSVLDRALQAARRPTGERSTNRDIPCR